MIQAFIIHKEDNVAIVAENVKAGQEVGYVLDGETVVLTAKDDIPIYHKIASREIAKGQQVLKYGEEIGIASQDIPKGSHVHTHNVDE